MEMEYSPRHSAGLHLLSPTHHHHSVDGFATIRQIRRSLSRSPSKPSRYSLYAAAATKANLTSPPSATALSLPRSPSGLSRTVTTDGSIFDNRLKTSRTGLVRTRSRRVSPNSPLRRALGDTTNHTHAPPRYATRHSVAPSTDHDQENMDCSEDTGHPAVTTTPETATPRANDTSFGEPVKIDFTNPGPDKLLQPVRREHASSMKSSPLKRSDGVMNLEAAHFDGARSTKRRSLHGASLGPDFNVFDPQLAKSPVEGNDNSHERPIEPGTTALPSNASSSFGWASPTPNSPQRRPGGLRRSTLQHRGGPARNKALFTDMARDSVMGPSSTRSRPRVSLDGSLPLRVTDTDTSSPRQGPADAPLMSLPPPAPRQHQSAPKPHPLSHAQTPSSLSSSPAEPPSAAIPASALRRLPSGLSKSLPLGALRPSGATVAESPDSDETCATPAGYQFAKPLPRAFMSTGLISKRNRRMDVPPDALFASTNMPDTPSKKASHIHLAPTPAPSALGRLNKIPAHAFGTPSTPFNYRDTKVPQISFGGSTSIFGDRADPYETVHRRGSFLSIDGEDSNPSPTHHLEHQSSNDELPPTPTKSNSTNTRPPSKGKSNSLRSSIFGRRTSMGPETFASPADMCDPSPSDDDDNPSPIAPRIAMFKPSPHTPHESLTPPDPSRLSISAEFRASIGFNSNSFPPATPTGPRFDASHGISLRQSHASSGYFANDVDTALTSRFGHVVSFGVGEFSQVYKVEKPLKSALSAPRPSTSSPGGKVWAVKKSRRPYTGVKDRQRKMQEVQILRALRGHEHIVELVDDWEAKNFLYIQTEFCENGNMKDFLLQAGFKGRLDDFRIWKILLELALGVQSIHGAGFIHLDLKPANVFIDWEGVLKIGDFGMASPWPAPAGIDGEGDREYIGPEVLSGRFDKPADIFSLGMIMLEIAGNIVLPDNGTSWQRLRAGDMSDLPSLTWSSDNNLARDELGDPIDTASNRSTELLGSSGGTAHTVAVDEDDDIGFLKPRAPQMKRAHDLVAPPSFMVDPLDAEALDHVVQWMIRPDPSQRPTIEQLLAREGVRWVCARRRAGATVYEGNYGPADDVLNSGQDVEMTDI